MTTATAVRTTATTQGAQGIPLSRLVRVELRKLVDTRAGFWLSASIGLLAVIIGVALLIANRNSPADLNFGQIFGVMNLPTSIILPVMAILLVTGEWSQRTALSTFAMEPRRERVVGAKLIAAILAAIGAVAVALVTGAIFTVIASVVFGDPAGAWSFTAAGLLNSAILQIFGLLLGFGFAALLLSTPPAIVAYFALPTVFSLLTELVPWFGKHLGEWIDPGAATSAFQSQDWLTGGEWARALVASIIWIAVPLALGVSRIMRSEVK